MPRLRRTKWACQRKIGLHHHRRLRRRRRRRRLFSALRIFVKKQLVESQLAQKLTLVLSQQEKIKVVRHFVSRRKTGYLLGKKGLAMTMAIDNLDRV